MATGAPTGAMLVRGPARRPPASAKLRERCHSHGRDTCCQGKLHSVRRSSTEEDMRLGRPGVETTAPAGVMQPRGAPQRPLDLAVITERRLSHARGVLGSPGERPRAWRSCTVHETCGKLPRGTLMHLQQSNSAMGLHDRHPTIQKSSGGCTAAGGTLAPMESARDVANAHECMGWARWA